MTVRDYLCDHMELPKSDVLYYELRTTTGFASGRRGQKPKIKVYTGTRGNTEREAEERLVAIWKELEKRLASG